MKIKVVSLFAVLLLFVACRERESDKENKTFQQTDTTNLTKAQNDSVSSDGEVLYYSKSGAANNAENVHNSKGIGPVDHVDLGIQINDSLAKVGGKLYNANCASCHRLHEKLTGPALAGVLQRRSPEFVMNMILNPEEMIEKDPIIQSLHAEYNTKMVDMGLSREEARAIVEYLRTTKGGTR